MCMGDRISDIQKPLKKYFVWFYAWSIQIVTDEHALNDKYTSMGAKNKTNISIYMYGYCSLNGWPWLESRPKWLDTTTLHSMYLRFWKKKNLTSKSKWMSSMILQITLKSLSKLTLVSTREPSERIGTSFLWISNRDTWYKGQLLKKNNT